MKLSFKTILPILLIFTLLILFAGCTTPSEEQPGYTPGTITGIIAAPCCTTSADPVLETCCVSPEYWCYYCQKTWSLQDGIEVVLTYGEDEVATTTTNSKGEFTFTNVDPGKNYVVTAYCPDFADNRPLVKDVALELIEGGSFDTNITDLVSTSLGLVVDFLVQYTDWGPEDISLVAVLADRPEFPHFPKFKKLVYEVRRVVENCEVNLLTDDDVLYATCRAAEEISGLDIGCGAGFTPLPGPGPTPGPCDVNILPDITDVKLDTISIFNIDPSLVADIHLIVGTPYEFCVTATDTDNVLPQPLTYSLTIGGDTFSYNNSNCLTITPEAGYVGTYDDVTVNVYDGCGTKTWGPITIVVDCPPLEKLVINGSGINGETLAKGECAVLNSIDIYYDDGNDIPDLILPPDPSQSNPSWTIPDEITITYDSITKKATVCLNDEVADEYSFTVVYTDDCEGSVEDTASVIFSNQYKLTVAVDPFSIQGDVITVPVVGGPYWYNYGDTVNLQVSSYPENYIFLRWTADSGVDVANPDDPVNAVVTMDQSKVVTAHFVPKEFFDGGTVTVGFEDLPRAESDFDYNDFILDIITNLVTVNIDDVDLLKEIQFDFTPKARGAGFNSSFYLFIPEDTFVLGGENSAQYVLNIVGSSYSSGSFGSYDVTADWDEMVIPWAREALPGTLNYTNTWEFLNDNPANPIPYENTNVTAILTITFDEPIAFDFSSLHPYSYMHGEGLFYVPYLKVYSGSSSPIPGTPQDTINAPNSGLDKRIITVPVDSWKWPEEGVFICDAYPEVGHTAGGIPDVFPFGWWLAPASDGSIYGDGLPRP